MAGQADNRAPYAKIAAHYTELIESGEMSPGELLPSIKNLSEKWGVSTATAEKALRKLRNEGLVRGFTASGLKSLTGPRRCPRDLSARIGAAVPDQAGGQAKGPTLIRPPSFLRPQRWPKPWASTHNPT